MRFPEEVPVLTDGVVTVRAHTPDDVPRIVEQCNDPASVTLTTVPVPYRLDDAVEWISAMIPKAMVMPGGQGSRLRARGHGTIVRTRW